MSRTRARSSCMRMIPTHICCCLNVVSLAWGAGFGDSQVRITSHLVAVDLMDLGDGVSGRCATVTSRAVQFSFILYPRTSQGNVF